MARNYFNNVEQYEITVISEMCKAIETRKALIIAGGKRWKMLVSGENYTYDYTYNLIRWGFARKARNTDHHAQLHPYCPNQYISGCLAHFLNTAVEMGFYTRTTEQVFNGGSEFQTIWM
jgi:hypothetical protein